MQKTLSTRSHNYNILSVLMWTSLASLHVYIENIIVRGQICNNIGIISRNEKNAVHKNYIKNYLCDTYSNEGRIPDQYA